MRRTLLCLLLATPAFAAPPPGANPDSDIARWIKTLRDPGGALCCSAADCRRTQIERRDDGTRWAWVGRDEFGANAPDRWMPITERVWNLTTADGPPPDGRAWVCFWGGQVRCAIGAGAS